MTKRDLVVKIACKTGMVQKDVANIIQSTLDYLSDAIVAGDKVELRDFGVFELKVRKSRVGRNPNAPTAEVVIPERVAVKFRSGKELKERVEKLTAKNLKK